MKSNPRLFTLPEANALLPEIDSHLSQLIEKKEAYARRHDELFMHELLTEIEQCGEDSGTVKEDLDRDAHELEAAVIDLEKEMNAIRKLGCVIRNLERGWIDFLAKKGPEFIFLCWKRGEKSIQYYHPAQGDMSERISLD